MTYQDSMNGINGNIVFDGFDNDTLDIIFSLIFFNPEKTLDDARQSNCIYVRWLHLQFFRDNRAQLKCR